MHLLFEYAILLSKNYKFLDMKKLIFSLLFIVAMLASCVEDKTAVEVPAGDQVGVTIGVAAPELSTRAAEGGLNSGLGAIDNFGEAEWARYDVRYILEVYDASEGYENFDTPVCQRMVQTFDSYQGTSFELRLIPNRTYKFVVWADFVEEGSLVDLNYNTANLKNITRTERAASVAMDESMDAYFIQQDILITEKSSHSLTLTRPFGKVRVITTDINHINYGTTASKVDVKFYNHPVFASLNAITGNAETAQETVTYSYTIAKDAPYAEGYDADPNSQTLFADYIYAKPQVAGDQEINFEMSVWGQDGRLIRRRDFNTQIPLGRNKLTTLIGDLCTATTEFNIIIDDNFSGYCDVNPDAEQLAQPAVEKSVEGNVVTLSWDAVENADYYAISYGENSTTTTSTSAEFALDYETEYTFEVQACSNNTMTYLPSDVAAVTVKTEVLVVKLEAPKVTYAVEEYKNVVMSWDAVENADNYTISYGDNTTTTPSTSAKFELDYDKEYTFTVQALSNDTIHYLASDVATVVVKTEAEPAPEYIYLKPNSNWVIDNARFAVYTWVDGGATEWYDMVDSDGDGIYEVEKSNLKSKIIFCRMNPGAQGNDWNSKWNQTGDLTLPADGTNMYTVAEGAWDNGDGTWSLYDPNANAKIEVTATLTFDDKANRTVFSSLQQVWVENEITLTNDKAASTSAIGDYAKPARFYANSKITVAAPGKIATIVFDCNSTSYATALKNSIGSAATVSSDKVTVTLDGSSAEFVIANLTAQIRLDAMTVTYAK